METARFDRHLEKIRDIFHDYRIFFICGAPKSGTTWLQKSLDAHPQIVCAGEGHFVDKFAIGIREPIIAYYRHQEIVAKNVYEDKAHYQHVPTDEFEFLTISFILSSFANLDIPVGTKLIGDKTPANVDHLEWLYALFPEMRVVNIVRDGRDTLASTFKHVERVMRANRNPSEIEAFLLENTKDYSLRWVTSLAKAEAFATKHPGTIHTLRYEDLKQDYAGTFSKVLDFLGADSTKEAVSQCESLASFKHLSGGRDAGEEDPNAFFRKGTVGDWRSSLQPQHLEIFHGVGIEWLARLGYEHESFSDIEKTR
jgi:hypothetical protein